MELVAKVSPSGIEDTSEELDDFSDTFEDVSEQAQDTAGDLSDFSHRWKGAMATVIGGLALATTGLLSQVPVLGELMTALGGTLDAVGFRLDKELRPAIGDLTDEIYDFNDAIREADGILGDLLDDFLMAAVVLAPIAIAVATLISIFGGIPVAIALVIVALTLFIFNVGGVRDKVIAYINDLVDQTVAKLVEWKNDGIALAKEFREGFTDGVAKLVSKVKTGFKKFTTTVKTILSTGFKEGKNIVFGILNELAAGVEEKVNKAIKILNKLPNMDMEKVNLGRLETDPVTSPSQTQQMAAFKRRDRQQQSSSRNRFARNRQGIELTLGTEASKLISSKIDQNPANRGR